jgi:hypothetical protein
MPAVGNTDELVGAIGFSAFERLVEVRGGRRLRVPTDIDRAQQIVQWLGLDAAGKLIGQFGGFEVDVPNRRPHALPSRRQMVYALIEAGRSDDDIVEIVHCTGRAVRGYRADWREENPEALPGSKQVASR